ncbi:MAG TPA: hypothetical protein VFZ21_07980, partial [Gemmatimonadaceae bacterium]|nr:hypothetical protein [Gemmatimonadaceae bacterium]
SAISLTLVVAFAGCAPRRAALPNEGIHPVAQLTAGFDPGIRRDVETLRRATERFHDRNAAGAAGYPTKLPACIADSTMGGMGHHMIDRSLFDEKLEIERPEMLIYAPIGDGHLELVAVEYVVPYHAVPATAKPPRLFGQEFKRYDQFNYWALHVWAWRRNPAGLFADWNPTVKC